METYIIGILGLNKSKKSMGSKMECEFEIRNTSKIYLLPLSSFPTSFVLALS